MVSGATSRKSIASVMTITASHRRPPAAFWTFSISGQVATTIIVAQIRAPRNGCRIHRLETIISPMNSTTSTMRATSRAGGALSSWALGRA